MNKPSLKQRLSTLKEGQSGILSAPSDPNCPEILRLLEMGMIEGCLVKLLRRAPWKGPLQIRVCETLLCIREEQASLFFIQPCGDV